MKTILFVDDEIMVLQALQRMLRPMRDEWEMHFAEGPYKAIALLEKSHFDAVVTDIRMPGMDGAQLLALVRDRYPHTVRLILSGHADRELIAQCLDVAHRFLSKPCEAEQLKAAIGESCAFDSNLVAWDVQKVLGGIERLPSIPKIYSEMEKAMANSNLGAQELASIILQDGGMTANILKIVNSAYFGLGRSIASPQEAVTYLGEETIKTLVLAHSLFQKADAFRTRSLTLEDLWLHTLTVSTRARAIARLEKAAPRTLEHTLVGAVLQDVGILVLATHFPEGYDRVVDSILHGGLDLTAAETQEFGTTHAEVGAYLLTLWGLPAEVVKVVSLHHHPERIDEAGFSPVLGVFAADVLVGEEGGHPIFRTGRFERPCLVRLGLEDKVEIWRRAGSPT